MEWLNKDLEKTGHRLEAVKHPDGTLQVAYKQIWSDEEIQRKTGEAGEAVFNTIGCNLLEDQANQAQQLLAFLNAVYQANMGKNTHFNPSATGAAAGVSVGLISQR